MHIMSWEEVSYEILDYKSKPLQNKTFHVWHKFNFLRCIYVNKATKFNYLSGTNIFQIVFDDITYSIPKELLTFSEWTVLYVSANNLQTWLSMHSLMCTSMMYWQISEWVLPKTSQQTVQATGTLGLTPNAIVQGIELVY